MLAKRKYDTAYREALSLPGAGDVRLRLLRRRDRSKLHKGFLSLSDETRYRRFHHPKKELSPAELEFFSDLDGWNHLALGAFRLRGGKEAELLGVARYFRLAPSVDVAEVAITVHDDLQGKGLGKALLARLVMAAAERRIGRLRFYLLYQNRPARALLEHSVWETTFENQGTVVAAELEIPPMMASTPLPAAGQLDDKLEELVRMIARGAVASPFSLSMLGLRSWWHETERLLSDLADSRP